MNNSPLTKKEVTEEWISKKAWKLVANIALKMASGSLPTTDKTAKATMEEVNKIVEDALTEAIEQGKAEAIKQASEVARNHLLTDWSGEHEVYEQIEQIASKIESLTNKADDK